MIKVAVCDDEEQICVKLMTITKSFFEEIQRQVWVAEFKDGYQLLKSNTRFDIIFLDIDMPDMNGIE
ncbi:MAG: response regulator, partial [Lachnospiraceae bacterium]|nr:response regulator [Lachnospiraceae bacterium]